MTYECFGSGSSGNCHVLKSAGGELLLLDCGLKIDEILRGIGWCTSQVVGCLVTHYHRDHSRSAEELIRRGVKCYSSGECWESLHIGGSCAVSVQPHEVIRCGSFDIMPFRLYHDCECYGFIIRHAECGLVVYITDTMMCRERFSGVSHYIIEASYSDDILEESLRLGIVNRVYAKRLMDTHQSIDECLSYLGKCDVSALKSVVLCHLSGNNGDAASFVERAEASVGVPCYVARRGKVVCF